MAQRKRVRVRAQRALVQVEPERETAPQSADTGHLPAAGRARLAGELLDAVSAIIRARNVRGVSVSQGVRLRRIESELNALIDEVDP